MDANQKPLNQIGIFWYQFTPRKLFYLMVSVNLVKFGSHWLSVFCGATLYRPRKLQIADNFLEKLPVSMRNIWSDYMKIYAKLLFRLLWGSAILLGLTVYGVDRVSFGGESSWNPGGGGWALWALWQCLIFNMHASF